MYRAALIDFDGTLVDSELVHAERWNETLATYGVTLDFDIYKREYSGVTAPVAAASMIDLHGLPTDPEALVAEKELLLEEWLADQAFPLMDGAVEVLDRLRGAGMRLGLVTGSPKRQIVGTLTAHGLDGVFSSLVTLDDVENGKPAPDCYLKSMAELDEPPGVCVAIEDSANGVASAKNAGLFCVAIRNECSMMQDLSRADRVVDRLCEAARCVLGEPGD